MRPIHPSYAHEGARNMREIAEGSVKGSRDVCKQASSRGKLGKWWLLQSFHALHGRRLESETANKAQSSGFR